MTPYNHKYATSTKTIGKIAPKNQLFKGDDNPLHDIFIVDTNSPTETISVAKKAKKLQYVYDTRYGGASAKKLFRAMTDFFNTIDLL